MTDDALIRQAILGHASTREAMRWLIKQVRADTVQAFLESGLFPSAPPTPDQVVRDGMGRPGEEQR